VTGRTTHSIHCQERKTYEDASVGGHRIGATKAIDAAIRQLKLAQQYDK
jgi:hypothetical protein